MHKNDPIYLISYQKLVIFFE